MIFSHCCSTHTHMWVCEYVCWPATCIPIHAGPTSHTHIDIHLPSFLPFLLQHMYRVGPNFVLTACSRLTFSPHISDAPCTYRYPRPSSKKICPKRTYLLTCNSLYYIHTHVHCVHMYATVYCVKETFKASFAKADQSKTFFSLSLITEEKTAKETKYVFFLVTFLIGH